MSDEKKDYSHLSSADLAEALKEKISLAIEAGNTAGVAKDISALRKLEKEIEADRQLENNHQADEATEMGIPDRMKVKRPYSMSPAAINARRKNSQHSTGPTSDEGKASSSRNAYKHGGHAATRILGLGKPCLSTCNQYPCALVEDGKCAPGDDCLNKEHLVEACLAIERALMNQDTGSLNEMVVFELAETMQLVRELRSAVLDDGVVVKSEKFDKDGVMIGWELKEHPALASLPKLVKAFGLTLTDFNLTPAAISKVKSDETVAEGIAAIFKTANGGLKAAREKKE